MFENMFDCELLIRDQLKKIQFLNDISNEESVDDIECFFFIVQYCIIVCL